MSQVIYSMNVSLDGFAAPPDGTMDWAAPDAEVMRVHSEQTRELGAHLCGRGLYEDMLPWETREGEFAETWQGLPKVVFSTTLEAVEGNATLARDAVADEVARAKLGSEGDVSVGGPGFAATVAALDLIDEYRQFVVPVVLGAGTPYFPPLDRRLELELLETRTFDSGVVYLRYRRV